MVERILYVYAGNSAIPPYDRTGMNFTALVVGGKTVDTSAGLNDDRIKEEARMAVKSGICLRPNFKPDGQPSPQNLNSNLEEQLRGLIEGGKE